MITPRQTRLVRTPDLRAFQRAIVGAACQGSVQACRTRAVVVPTRAAAGQLRLTIEARWSRGSPDTAVAIALPEVVSRDEWYRLLHGRLVGAPPLASPFERRVLFGRAAREAVAGGAPAPFALRLGLVVEMLALYDELRRRHRTVEAFERLLVSTLEPSADTDRGAARLLAQTRFLAATFSVYERLVSESGRLDEHALRARLLEPSVDGVLRHVVVTVSDRNADPVGLWPADFDLLTRLPGLERVDVIATEKTLATGFRERLHDWLPGIEEEAWVGEGGAPPTLLAPPAETGVRHWLVRDREEELVEAVRRIRAHTLDAGAGAEDASERVAIVFQRPLPYVYLARRVFGAARMPYQAHDALPLAAEPYASTLDLVLSAATTDFTRADLIALLRSPHVALTDDRLPLAPTETSALDYTLQQERYLGGAERLVELALQLERGGRTETRRAARAAAAVAGELAPLRVVAPPSIHLACLAGFLERHDCPLPAADVWHERHERARCAVHGAIEAFARAHQEFDDAPVAFEEVAVALRRWIEGQTFAPRTGDVGPHLVDAAAARYGEFDEVRLVGLVEHDWPEATAGNVFYPAGLLAQLGWPVQPDRLRAARAAFGDLLRLPAIRLVVSAFTLEDDAIVRPSPFLEEVEEAQLPVAHLDVEAGVRVFVDEALMDEPLAPDAVDGEAAAWLALRAGRAPAENPQCRDAAGPRMPDALRVSAVERYLSCPFRYFAAHVLRLGEERDDEPGLSALERGRLVHEVFERFFREWQADGRGAITPSNWSEAFERFARVAKTQLRALSEADRALEQARLVGSAVARGLGARAFDVEVEANADVGVVERLLEHPLDGEFTFDTEAGVRRLALRGKADRIDLLADGTIRVLDYKLGRAPKPSRTIQLPVYGMCAQQRLSGRHGRAWRFTAAGYLAFGEHEPFVALAPRGTPFPEAVSNGVARLLDAADRIARGEFPVRPAEPFLCAQCPYPAVCRKDYVSDE